MLRTVKPEGYVTLAMGNSSNITFALGGLQDGNTFLGELSTKVKACRFEDQ